MLYQQMDTAEQLKKCVWQRNEQRSSKQKCPDNYSFLSDLLWVKKHATVNPGLGNTSVET